jgi:hypothetical protein
VQYSELGGVNGGNRAYMAALENLDGDMPQYISDNTDDEISHAQFLNAYLKSQGAPPVNLDAFRTLPSSKAKGAKQIGRLTNLQELDVDTSWYLRYRSTRNPDLGASFPQAVTIRNQPAIPLTDADTPPGLKAPVPPKSRQERRLQAIANTAGFHFALIEQGGASLYSAMALKASSLEVLRIVVSIGGVEVNHFAIWHDAAGNSVAQPLAGVVDPETHVSFPDLNAHGGEATQTNLVMRRRRRGGQGPHRRPAVQGSVTAVLQHAHGAGNGGRRCPAPRRLAAPSWPAAPLRGRGRSTISTKGHDSCSPESSSPPT